MTVPPPISGRGPACFMARQFGLPSGPIGHLVTRLLARGNARFNHWLVHELAGTVANPQRVIELGCGPGVALQELLMTYPEASIFGIDPSAVVLKSARHRNADAIRAGRLELVVGDVATAAAYGPADLIVACHVLYFWTNPMSELRLIREALTATGHLALGYQLRQNMPHTSQRAFPSQGFILYDSDDQVAELLEKAGFTSPEVLISGDDERPQGRLAVTTATPQ